MELQKTLYECYRWRANWGELVMARQRIELAPEEAEELSRRDARDLRARVTLYSVSIKRGSTHMGDVYAIHFWCNHAFDLVELGVLYWMVLRARRIQLLIVNTRLEVQRTIAAQTAEIRRLLTRDRVP
jgi:hypothetical protein